MTRLWLDGVVIVVETDAQDQPVQFGWQNSTHTITRIEQVWEIQTDWWDEAGEVWRMTYAVITDSNLLCVLYHDRLSGQWILSKVYD